MKTNILTLFLGIFALHIGLAQSHKGNINAVKESGLHKLLLSQEIRSASNENTAYFRILDANNREVPYVVLDGEDRQFSIFTALTIHSKEVIKDSMTSLIITNDANHLHDKLTLKIANTAVNKYYDVGGSNDQNQWFGLVSNAYLSQLNNPDTTFVEKTISFPSNQYHYLRIDFKDKKSLPINVLDVGLYISKLQWQQPMAITGFKYKISEDTKRKITTIAFTAANAYHIDAMVFSIKTPSYLRNAQLIVKNTQTIKKQKVTYDDVNLHFQLNSTQNTTINLNGFSQKQFFINIENQDNQPLEISNIKLLQKPLYVIANLKLEQNYHVVVDSTYSKPSYDLVNFIPTTTTNVPEATITQFKKVNQVTKVASEKAFWQTNAFMWACIVVGILAIGYFAMGLLKDMKGSE